MALTLSRSPTFTEMTFCSLSFWSLSFWSLLPRTISHTEVVASKFPPHKGVTNSFRCVLFKLYASNGICIGAPAVTFSKLYRCECEDCWCLGGRGLIFLFVLRAEHSLPFPVAVFCRFWRPKIPKNLTFFGIGHPIFSFFPHTFNRKTLSDEIGQSFPRLQGVANPNRSVISTYSGYKHIL